MISTKVTVTLAVPKLQWFVELWMSSETLLRRSWTVSRARGSGSSLEVFCFQDASRGMGQAECSEWGGHPKAARLLACFARFPKTNIMASMTFDLPLPFGPTTEEKH